jgi:hypothetical protein
MIPFQALALVTLLAAEPPTRPVDPIAAMMRDMPPPDWLQRELRGAPPNSMADTRTQVPTYIAPPPRPPSYVQGLLGVTELHVKTLDIGFGPGQWESSDDATMPLIGGAVQRMLGGGENLHYGLEGGFMFGWMGNVQSVVVGSGAVLVAANNDVFMSEFSGGLAAELMLGDKLRLYGGAGGLLDWAIVDVTFSDPSFGFVSASGSGWGLGVYTRLGFDVLLQSGMRLGFCWRWFDTDLDMGAGIDDLELDGMQYMLTFTKSM